MTMSLSQDRTTTMTSTPADIARLFVGPIWLARRSTSW